MMGRREGSQGRRRREVLDFPRSLLFPLSVFGDFNLLYLKKNGVIVSRCLIMKENVVVPLGDHTRAVPRVQRTTRAMWIPPTMQIASTQPSVWPTQPYLLAFGVPDPFVVSPPLTHRLLPLLLPSANTPPPPAVDLATLDSRVAATSFPLLCLPSLLPWQSVGAN
jgi:hypothetical protein